MKYLLLTVAAGMLLYALDDYHAPRLGEATKGDYPGLETATFGAGCFWSVEAAFRDVPGVVDTAVGFMGGRLEHPSYEQVCAHRTGHAEVCQVTFDPHRVSYDQLLEVFWSIHDPTLLNRQGPDVGDQYRSVIFCRGEAQRQAAQAGRRRAQPRFSRPIVTQIAPAATFWRAEEYHQRYLEKHGRKSCRIR